MASSLHGWSELLRHLTIDWAANCTYLYMCELLEDNLGSERQIIPPFEILVDYFNGGDELDKFLRRVVPSDQARESLNDENLNTTRS